ncbi:MAG: hypothetical protein ACP5FH_07050 [Terracidiphilus sp.]
MHIGGQEAGPKIDAIFSIIESCRWRGVPFRKYLADVPPGMASRSIQLLAEPAPAAYAARMTKQPIPAWATGQPWGPPNGCTEHIRWF